MAYLSTRLTRGGNRQAVILFRAYAYAHDYVVARDHAGECGDVHNVDGCHNSDPTRLSSAHGFHPGLILKDWGDP